MASRRIARSRRGTTATSNGTTSGTGDQEQNVERIQSPHEWAKQLQAQSEGMQLTLRAIAWKRPHGGEREQSDTEDTLQRPARKEQHHFNKRMKTIFKNIVSCMDEIARVVEEARKGMENVENRNLTNRIADSDGWVVVKKFNQKPLVESEGDRRHQREARQDGK